VKTREITRTALFTALICAAAIIFRYVPSNVVPYSILPLLVLLAGYLLGPRLGAWCLVVYVLLGLIGFPVFATAPFGGPAYVLKPTFGFLLGDILAAYSVGKVLQLKKDPGIIWGGLAVVCGIFCLYVVGLSYMYLSINLFLHKPIALIGVVKLGFLPFIWLDLVKGAGAVILGRLLSVRLAAAGVALPTR